MKITTNNVPRQMQAFNDISLSAQSDFDYLSEDDKYVYRLVQYKGRWYDVYDTQVINVDPQFSSFGYNVKNDSPLAKWDSVISESYFSGKLFKLCADETVIVGGYYE